jgi:hypothetical protein
MFGFPALVIAFGDLWRPLWWLLLPWVIALLMFGVVALLSSEAREDYRLKNGYPLWVSVVVFSVSGPIGVLILLWIGRARVAQQQRWRGSF